MNTKEEVKLITWDERLVQGFVDEFWKDVMSDTKNVEVLERLSKK